MIMRDDGRGREPLVRSDKFELGRIQTSDGAREAVPPAELAQALRHHAGGDWGVVCDEDWDANDRAVVDSGRIQSVYRTKSGVKFWIVTRPDRAITTVLLPDEHTFD